MTDEKGLYLCVMVADCLPILIHDPVSGQVAAVHAGWRGTLANIAGSAVSAMVQVGGTASNIVTSIGPSIGVCCYSVPRSRARQFRSKYGSKSVMYTDDAYYLDLQLVNSIQLQDAGVLSSSIDILPYCTHCTGKRFYSYRRGDRDKRMISYIALRA